MNVLFHLFSSKAQVEKCQGIMSVVLLDSPKFSDTSFKALAECKLLKVSIEGYYNNQIIVSIMYF